jgi:hypothetical protein
VRLKVLSLWCWAPSKAGESAGGPGTGLCMNTLSHLGGFCAFPATRQGASRGSRPAAAEAVQGAAQGAQTLPEPELGLAGAGRVVRQALTGPMAAWVQRSWLAEYHEQQAGGQQQEDAGQGNEHRERASHLHKSPRSDRNCEEDLGAGKVGAFCVHGACDRHRAETQRLISWTRGRERLAWEHQGG